jgi:N-acetylglucosaminyldiphosphoundecaprenol N-acetyl-beta-D-mannosaminyltransferase
MQLNSEIIVGYQVAVEPISNVVNCITGWMDDNERSCHYFACLNPHSVEIAAGDKSFHNSLTSADFLTADGIGIVYASKLLGGSLGGRITGMDVFHGVSAAMNASGRGTCYFLGSTEETLQAIRRKMAEDYPNVEVAGAYSPPFRPEFTDEDNRAMIEAINAAAPDVLWVGLAAPKQEKWIYEHRDRLAVNFAGPIGAVFDFYVGNVKRVNPYWQKLGFEWLPRLMQEPRRLWRRTFVSAPRFVVRTLWYYFARRRYS